MINFSEINEKLENTDYSKFTTKGYPSSSNSCALANYINSLLPNEYEALVTLDNCWVFHTSTIGVVEKFPLPEKAIEFRKAFDRGEYPHLIKERERIDDRIEFGGEQLSNV